MPRINVETSKGVVCEIDAPVGRALMTVLRDAGFGVEGTCEGSLACATCHVIVDADWYPRLPAVATDETHMLDFAEGLCATSRLSCQIPVREDLDGLILKLPAGAGNHALLL